MWLPLKQYLETALWSSSDDSGNNLDSEYSIDDIDSESIYKSEAELTEFIDKAHKILPEGYDLTQVAHDFWLTRNRHGAGFWDGDYPKDIGEKLTKLSREYKEVNPIVGDDGLIYFY